MFKKIWDFIKGIAEGAGGTVAVNQVSDLLEKGLDKFYDKHPDKATALVQSLYAWLPTLKELAEDTGTTLDDKLVAEVKKDFQTFAALHDIDLPEDEEPEQ